MFDSLFLLNCAFFDMFLFMEDKSPAKAKNFGKR